MDKKIDYTKKRLGSTVRQWEYIKADGTSGIGKSKIRRCPKCGRKGELTIHRYFSKRPGHEVHCYTHTGHLADVCGMNFIVVDERCEIGVEATTTMQ